jgi:predicted nuclease of predicted toxin-antitoxin system
LRILFDNNVPVGVRSFLARHDVRTILEMKWSPKMNNGELLRAAETAGFDVLVTSDQNIRYQHNLAGRKLAVVVLGSNIWNVVRNYAAAIAAAVVKAAPGSYETIAMPIPPRPRRPFRER